MSDPAARISDIAFIAWNDMKMELHDCLAGSLSIVGA